MYFVYSVELLSTRGEARATYVAPYLSHVQSHYCPVLYCTVLLRISTTSVHKEVDI